VRRGGHRSIDSRPSTSCSSYLPADRVSVIPQPRDGSCLFHSLARGLGKGGNGGELRNEVASFIVRNKNAPLGGGTLGTSVKDWIKFDSNVTPRRYASDLVGGKWGGAIEVAVAAQTHGVDVDVYTRQGNHGFQRTAQFQPVCKRPPSGGGGRGGGEALSRVTKVKLLYTGRCHYDLLRADTARATARSAAAAAGAGAVAGGTTSQQTRQGRRVPTAR
jgi:hypothetical protein